MKLALAMFAKSPRPGEVKTRLTPPLTLEQGAELYRCMFLDTVARSRALPVDIFVCYHGGEEFFQEHAAGVTLMPQEGETLTARLQAAFASLHERGYGATVVIGTDAPDLPMNYVQQAFELLAQGHDVVFGPAEDGGYYLVALREPHPELFEDIPWSSEKVLEESLYKAELLGLDPALLPTWYDVDSYDDLQRPGLSDPANGAPITRAFIAAMPFGP